MATNTELAAVIEQFGNGDGITHTEIDGFNLYRSSISVPRHPVVYDPTICVIAQGRKEINFGEQKRGYDPDNYLINSITMPLEAEVCDVSKETPYLGLSLQIDRYMVSQLMVEMDKVSEPMMPRDTYDIILSSKLNDRLNTSFIKLIQTLADPMDREVLAPSLKREIFYEVLKGPHGYLLRNCVTNHAGANRIAPVVHFLENNFHQNIDIDTISNIAGMSTSSLHEHFKQVTSMSPMQFVKNLRLHSAHSLLLTGRAASEVSYQVGYSSPSQFSREFKRLFGSSPREIQQALA